MIKKKYNKLSGDCGDELMKLVKDVCEIEKRTIANFVRLACEEKAKKIIKENKKEKEDPQ